MQDETVMDKMAEEQTGTEINDLVSGTGDRQQELYQRVERQRRIQRVRSSGQLRKDAAAPPPPEIFSAATAGIESIQFDWTVVDDPLVTAYNIYSSPENNASSAARINVVFQNPDLTGSMHYVDFPGSLVTRYYWVSAVNQQGKESSRTAMQIGTAPTTTGIPNSIPYPDNLAIIKNATDATKKLVFSAALLTSGATRTYSFPDANVILAGINYAQTWTVNQTHSSNILATPDATRDIGSASSAFANGYFQNVWIGDGSAVNRWRFLKNTTNIMFLNDQLGVTLMGFQGSAASPFVSFAGDVLPSATLARSLGNSADYWLGTYTYTLNLPNGSAPATNAGTVYFNGSFKGCADGANFRTFPFLEVAQTWTATQTMRSIFPSANVTYDLGFLGGGGGRWQSVYADKFDFSGSLVRGATTTIVDGSDNINGNSYAIGGNTVINPTQNLVNIVTATLSSFIDASLYKAGGTSGVVSFGPSAVTSITVKGGIITAIS